MLNRIAPRKKWGSLRMPKLITLAGCLLVWFHLAAQETTTLSPAERFRQFPPFKLLKADSSTWWGKEDLSKKKDILLVIFSPSCDHCRQKTESLVQQIDLFRSVQIVMATTAPLDEMRRFIRQYGLDQFPGITVARDVQYMLPSFFQLSNLPYLAFYNRKKELIRTHEGSMTVEKMAGEFRK